MDGAPWTTRRRASGDSVSCGTLLLRHQLLVEPVRAADGLRGVVDEDVQGRLGVQQVPRERLHRRDVPQVEAVQVQAVRPVGGVGLGVEAAGGGVGKPRGDDHLRPVAQQAQHGLVADLDAPAGHQRRAPGQVGAQMAHPVVELGALRAEQMVEEVDFRVVRLADVAALRLVQRPDEAGRPAAAGQQRPPAGASRWICTIAVVACRARSSACCRRRSAVEVVPLALPVDLGDQAVEAVVPADGPV